MKKVYCKNCKYKIFNKEIGKTYDKCYGEYTIKRCNPYTHNANNNCKWYTEKRKLKKILKKYWNCLIADYR